MDSVNTLRFSGYAKLTRFDPTNGSISRTGLCQTDLTVQHFAILQPTDWDQLKNFVHADSIKNAYDRQPSPSYV